MIRRNQRFRNHLDENLINLNKNLFISPSDPQYYEKVIRYLDSNSPEAHYKLGQKFELLGNRKRALFHYKEALKTYPSPFYSAANRAIHNMEQESAAAIAQDETAAYAEPRKQLLSPFMKTLLIVLFVLNLLLVILFFGDQSIYKTISSLKEWGVGTDITYETVDVPYVMYLQPDVKKDAIESALHKQALELAKDMPEHNIIIYGVLSSDVRDRGKTLLLTNDEMTKSAIVIAQYHPASDRTVKIRFMNGKNDKHQPLSAIGANLVRTALDAYRKDFGVNPASLDLLVQDYPNNYLSFIPMEASSGANQVYTQFDGNGGWVYNPSEKELDQMFYPNVDGAEAVPYEPLYIAINKDEHHLRLVSGTHLLWDKEVGLGANESTPVGDFIVQDRVMHPTGKRQQSYGDAGLGLGAIALHGTLDESSIGNDKSSGCVRLTNEDIMQLFAFVPKGTEVQIAASSWEPIELNHVKDAQSMIPHSLPNIDQTPEHIIFHWLG
ncbi:L,D-transpeptidase family protein [Paenibacillus sedimenti]|uniref:L,D-transpeptidase family protein n=1 Tax=Paenibacillus sedimenti TaxID=2770274 RepID=A0A926KS43_9BACL|nr:L,D-transpeptidase family protein [Paenibacillus sedimenti]MBD0383059.1 L,D-transpeptidase family protein [Paenibacillus sedimenti]